MARRFLRPTLSTVAALATLSLAMPAAHAGKEVFVRSKPHVNVGTISNQNSAAKKKTKSGAPTSLYFPESMLESKRSHPDFLWLPHSHSTAPKAAPKVQYQLFQPDGVPVR